MFSLTTKTVLRLDSSAVTKAVGAANQRALMMAGGRLRKTARNSIPFRKRRTTVSKPGKPPNAHRRGKGIKTILFGYDRRTHSLVTGFAKLGGVSGRDVPQTLETGGSARVRVRGGSAGRRERRRGKDGRFISRTPAQKRRIREYYKSKRSAEPVKTKTVRVRKRPTMVPALNKTTPTLSQLWEDQVKPGGLFG